MPTVNLGEVDLPTVAHDAADSGNPIKVGARATTASIAAVANNDRIDLLTTSQGALLVHPFAVPENILGAVTAAIIDTTATAVIAAQAAGVRIYVTSVGIVNSHATVGTVVEIRDGTTVIDREYVAALTSKTKTYPTPLRGTAATALNAACVTTGSNVYVSAQGFKAA